jgi:HSP20 family protein
METTIAKRQNGKNPASFGNVVDSIFQNSLRRFFDSDLLGTGNYLSAGGVPVNIRETEQQYQMDVIAPGCRKEDFNINISDSTLTISFDHKEQKKEENENTGWVRNEYWQRSFSRSFTLDDTVDVNNITATYTDGILRVTLPKNEKAKKVSRHIDIR